MTIVIMKQKKTLLIAFLAMLLGTNIQAQNSGLEGTYLNVGSGNTLVGNGGGLWGNAMGENNYVESANSLAVGNNDTIGQYSIDAVALGGMNRINGNASMAFGNNIKINGKYSFGAGRFLRTTEQNSMILGYGIPGSGNLPDLFLENSYSYCLMIGLNSTKPTLTVGPSPNNYLQGSYDKTGKVGIGDIPMPEIAAKLHIRSDAGEDASLFLQPASAASDNACLLMRDSTHFIQVDSTGCMTVRSKNGPSLAHLLLEGRVGINVPDVNRMPLGYSLLVFGGIMTDKVTIKSYSQWHDYVFDSKYHLMPLPELKDFVAKHHHLPDVPPADDVIANGVEIGEMQGVLLKKIEELTLYTIQLQEQLEQVQKQLKDLKEKDI